MAEKRKIEYCTGKQTGDGGDPVILNALSCMSLCELAYKSQLEIERELPEYGYHGTDVVFFGSSLTQGFIIEFENIVAVSFRGSFTLREWLNNLKTWRKRTPYGGIHAGLYQTIQQVGPMILRIVLPRLKRGRELVVTGHSRGGALAVLFAIMVLLNGHDTNAVITYGSPMFCDSKLAGFVDNSRARMPVFRIVNKWDVVPMLPSLRPYVFWRLLLGIPSELRRICRGLWRLISRFPKRSAGRTPSGQGTFQNRPSGRSSPEI